MYSNTIVDPALAAKERRYQSTYQTHFASPNSRPVRTAMRTMMAQGQSPRLGGMPGQFNQMPGQNRPFLPAQVSAQRIVFTPREGAGQPSQTISNAGSMMVGARKKAKAACLGVIRLDYDYPPAPGDIDSPESFGYDVFYRVVPGLTFEMCQSGKLSPDVRIEFLEAVAWLEKKGVSAITGDCGFMMYFQELARSHTKKPVFMSSLAQLPAVTCAFGRDELIAILTANGASLKPMRALIKDECGVDVNERRFVFVGCEDVPGFEAVALGQKVNVQAVTPGIVAKCQRVVAEHPAVRAFLMECTELPPYSDAVRAATGLPVYDAITCADFFISSLSDNARFGINNWQQSWDGVQDQYQFGKNLTKADREQLVNKCNF